MIFNKKLDESLRLIIGSDGKRRDKVISFIKSIPSELFDQIYIQLEKYEEYEKNSVDIFDREDYCLKGECVNNYDKKYTFVIDMFDESITIARYVSSSLNKFLQIDDGYTKTFEITLYAQNRYNNIDNFDEQRLGRIFNSVQNISIDYKVIKTIIGNMITYLDDYGFRKYQSFELNDNYDDLNIDSLDVISRNRKVRRRVK